LRFRVVAHVGRFVQPPEELGGDHVLVTLPAQFAKGLTHDALGLAGRVTLGVVEEVHAGLFGRVAGTRPPAYPFRSVGVGEGDPAAEGLGGLL